jgi:hypothetical protein
MKLVSFRVFHPKNVPLSHLIKQDISKSILTHKSFGLRSIDLSFHCNYLNLVTNIALNLTVISLHMIFDGLINTLHLQFSIHTTSLSCITSIAYCHM